MKRPVLLGILIASLSASAWGIGINPTRFEFTARPGEVCRGSFTITNDQQHEVYVSVEMSEGPMAAANRGMVRVQDWLSIETNEIAIPAGMSRAVSFKAQVLPGARGVYSGRLSFVDRSSEAFSTSLTVPVYITIKGTEVESWEVREFTLQDTPVGLGARAIIDNRGNVVLRLNGTLTIIDQKKNGLLEVPVGGGMAVFPEQDAIMPLSINELTLAPGRYEARFVISGARGREKSFVFAVEKSPEGVYRTVRVK
jgi:hypothetical protein